MTDTPFNLSEKIVMPESFRYYREEDVKEFIRLMKEEIDMPITANEIINNLAGDDLT